MSKIKITIVEDEKELANVIKEYLERKGDIEVIEILSDGRELVKKLNENPPEVLLMDNILPHKDGLALMKEVQNDIKSKNIKKILMTGFPREEIVKRAYGLDVDYFLMKPFDYEVLYETIKTLALDKKTVKKDINEELENVFKNLGIALNLKGSLYLKEAIKITLEDEASIKKMTTKVYPEIAKKYDTNANSVERCIRHLIQKLWEEKETEVYKLLGYKGTKKDKKPSNSMLVGLINSKIKFS